MDRTIDFLLGADCNLRCSYCYVSHDTPRTMPLDVALRAVDVVLEDKEISSTSGAIWGFVGGEPLLHCELISDTIAHVRRRTYEMGHPWFDAARFAITTNGVLYDSPGAQDLVAKYGASLSVSITLDGSPSMHNAARVFPDGTGSYDSVSRNIKLWLRQTKERSTKVTISPENIERVAEGVLHAFDLGIQEVNANCVFEDVWTAEHPAVLHAQMVDLAASMRDRGIVLERCSLFSRFIGSPVSPVETSNWCGCGKWMLAVDASGTFYPCNRFAPSALRHHPPISVGDIHHGIDHAALSRFDIGRIEKSTAECLHCEIASGCAWCSGNDYDTHGVIDRRTTTLCLMHRARVDAARLAWAREAP